MQEPGEWYEYRLRDSSDTLSFRASPRPGPENQVSFVVYGDMGESDHARAKAPGYIFSVCLLRVFMMQTCWPCLLMHNPCAKDPPPPLVLLSTHLSKDLAVNANVAQK